MAGGRPSDYKPEYCDQLVQHMAQGLSFEAFAGVIGCVKGTLYNWAEQHDEFLYAKKRGIEACRLFWEKAGIDGLMNKDGVSMNATVWIFNMKNRFKEEWADKQQLEHSGNGVSLNIIMPEGE